MNAGERMEDWLEQDNEAALQEFDAYEAQHNPRKETQMSITDRLGEIEARANAATEGPWAVRGDEDYGYEVHGQREASSIPGVWRPTEVCSPGEERNAEFIAHARADVPALVAALRAVLDLHKLTIRTVEVGRFGKVVTFNRCAECAHVTDYPCQTVRAVTAALNNQEGTPNAH